MKLYIWGRWVCVNEIHSLVGSEDPRVNIVKAYLTCRISYACVNAILQEQYGSFFVSPVCSTMKGRVSLHIHTVYIGGPVFF